MGTGAKMNWRALRIILLVTAIAAMLVGDVLLSGRIGPYAPPAAILTYEFQQVQTAVLNYHSEYGEDPVAADNASLTKMLEGANPRRIIFASFRPGEQSAAGELLDPWGTPLEMSPGAGGALVIRSGGPDRTFGTADDVTDP